MLPSLELQGLSSKRPRKTSSPATPDGTTDHLSSLPEEMMQEILRRMPLEDAVRTSTLAKPWRYRWTKCPGLVIAGYPPAAVDLVLTRYACDVSRAHLEVPPESLGKIDSWIRALAAKGIQCLAVCFNPEFALRLPPLPASLFSCRDLTSLLLKHCDIPDLPPEFDGFPGLLGLDLENVNFGVDGERTFEALIAKSPLLSCLSIRFPSISASSDDAEENYKEWTIRAPNLKILRMRAWQDYGWSVDDLPLIEQACVQLEGPELPRILPGLANVWNLSVQITDDTILRRLPYFINLKCLSLYILLANSSTVLSMFCILSNAPILEDLHVTLQHENEEPIEVNMKLVLNTLGTLERLFSRLKYFRLDQSIGHTNEMQFIELLMSKATVLQQIEISVRDDSLKSLEVVNDELSQYKKASPQAEVIVNRDETKNVSLPTG